VKQLELEEVEPGRWRVRKFRPNPLHARSPLPRPMIISDIMDPVEQVDGRFYTSKSAFRKVGRSLGLIEVGNEKMKPKTRASADPVEKRRRRDSIQKAIAEYQQGRRVGR
jgi:hypothetical protein